MTTQMTDARPIWRALDLGQGQNDDGGVDRRDQDVGHHDQ